jgi:phosphoribosyl-dephospho-CoA transferase
MPLNEVVLERKIDVARNWDIDQLYAEEQALKATNENWLELSEGRTLIDV